MQSHALRILFGTSWATPDPSAWIARKAALLASQRCAKPQQTLDQKNKALYNQNSRALYIQSRYVELMTHREQDVLHSIVESYIHSGEPVASRTIAKQRKDNLSAATIRNVMADLYEAGYLAQPHTSAGRVPTEKAFRSYVQSLRLRRMAAAEIERLRSEFGRLNTVEERVEHTSRMLTSMTNGVGL